MVNLSKNTLTNINWGKHPASSKKTYEPDPKPVKKPKKGKK